MGYASLPDSPVNLPPHANSKMIATHDTFKQKAIKKSQAFADNIASLSRLEKLRRRRCTKQDDARTNGDNRAKRAPTVLHGRMW